MTHRIALFAALAFMAAPAGAVRPHHTPHPHGRTVRVRFDSVIQAPADTSHTVSISAPGSRWAGHRRRARH